MDDLEKDRLPELTRMQVAILKYADNSCSRKGINYSQTFNDLKRRYNPQGFLPVLKNDFIMKAPTSSKPRRYEKGYVNPYPMEDNEETKTQLRLELNHLLEAGLLARPSGKGVAEIKARYNLTDRGYQIVSDPKYRLDEKHYELLVAAIAAEKKAVQQAKTPRAAWARAIEIAGTILSPDDPNAIKLKLAFEAEARKAGGKGRGDE